MPDLEPGSRAKKEFSKMSPMLVGFIGIMLVLALLMLGFPIGFGMILVGVFGYAYLTTPTAALSNAGVIPYDLITKYDYLVLPLFLLMGSVFYSSGLGSSLFKLANNVLGRLPGGLAMASIGACAIFAAVSSSSIATAVTIGATAIPEMRNRKYDDALATGCIAAGGTLGILIPPSSIFIIYGILTQTSIVDLFMAGLVPGVLLALLMIIMIYIRAKLNPKLGPIGPSSTFKEKISSLGESIEVWVLIILVLGGLIIGWFTPTEAGGIAGFGAIVISLVRKRLNWRNFKEAMVDTVRTSGMIFIVLIGAFLLNSFVAISTIPMELADMVAGFGLPPFAVMILIIMVYLVLGCFIDTMSMILLTIPVFFPLVTSPAIGIDPLVFGVVIVLVTEMAMITPPVGMNVYVIHGVVPGVPMQTIFKGIIPFVGVELFFVVVLLFIPQIATWLPMAIK
jgi:C4-dicarboxylate transporter, DctM subunit